MRERTFKRVLVLSDGKPGHLTKSHGICSALGKIVPVEVDILRVSIRIKLFLNFFLILCKCCPERIRRSALLMRMLYTESLVDRVQACDLVVSSGANTLPANIFLGSFSHVSNIFTGSLRGADTGLFDLVISREGREAIKGDNVLFLERSPVNVSVDAIKEAASQFAQKHNIDQGADYWTLLIGGATKEYGFSRADIESVLSGVFSLAKKEGARILLSTSRRTGSEFEALIKSIVSENRDWVQYSVIWGDRAEKVVSAFLGLSSLVFVTEESGSMINEAIMAGRPVVSVYPGEWSEQNKVKEVVTNSEAENRLVRISCGNVADMSITDTMKRIAVLDYDMLSLLAQQIEEKLGLKN